MDKSFWFAIRDQQYALPDGQDLLLLTDELLGYLGSTDPELRDTIAYESFANWLEKGLYTPEQLRPYLLHLLLNLQEGLGEPESDSLFLRAFSILWLAEIANIDNQTHFLDGDEVRNLLSKGLAYLEAEADPRGYVPGKGWGHALAHTADLLYVLARGNHLHAEDLSQILDAIARKMLASNYWIYVHGEDDRLARAVLAIFERDLLDQSAVHGWLNAIARPGEIGWKDWWLEESRTAAFFNTRSFLRSLILRVLNAKELPHRDVLLPLLLETERRLKG